MINEKTWCFSPETYALLRKKQKAEIDAWLDEHVAQETGYVLDDSLTLADAAAQAKAVGDALALKAALASPAFTGTPTAPTPTAGDNSTKIPTTAFVRGEIDTADAALEQMILASFPTDNITNQPIASFTDGADGIPVKALTVNITPVQAGSGDPSPINPINIRTISGWTGANIENTNVAFSADISSADGYYDNDGIYHDSNNTKHTTDFIPTYANAHGKITGIYVSGVTASIQRVYFYDSFKNFISRSDFPTGGTEGNDDWTLSFTTPNNCAYVRFQFYTALFSAHYSALKFSYIVAAVSWQTEAGTVYAGTLTWLGGNRWKVTATHKKVSILSSVGEFDFYTNPNRVTITNAITDHKHETTNNALCDRFVPLQNSQTGSALSANDNSFNFNSMQARDELRFNVTGLGFSTVDQFKQYLDAQEQASVPVTLCYELATPVEYTLTIPDSEIKTLLGNNNISADCGDIEELTYRADVGLYIDKKLAEAANA